MTVAIKGMDMAGGCGVCSGLCKDVYPYICYRCDIEFTEVETNLIIDLPGLISKKCKLVALPEENKDMSWEELVEKVKELKSDLLTVYEDYISYSAFEGCTHILEFGIDNQIVFRYADEQKVIHTDKSFYQMWVIIKALIGDER